MNRRQRRAARARGDDDPPAAMVEIVRRMATRLLALQRSGGEPPLFALPPRDVMAIAPLDMVIDRVGLNASARELALDFCRIGCEVKGPRGQPTINMLRAALDLVDFPREERPLEHFGSFAVVQRGPEADN